MPRPRSCLIRAFLIFFFQAEDGIRDYILLFRMRARWFPGENDSAVSFQPDRHKSRCCDRRSLGPCDRPRAAAQNKSPVALRSACKIAGKADIRFYHPAAPSTSDLGDPIALEMRPLLDRRQI